MIFAQDRAYERFRISLALTTTFPVNVGLKFCAWLEVVTHIDPFDFADWLRENSVWTELEDGWTQDDVYAHLREKYLSAKRLNLYPSEVQS